MPAVPEDADEPDRGEEIDQRQEVRAQAGLVDRTVEHVVGFTGEALLLQTFRAEALHDTHTRHALFDDARQVGELLLQREPDGIHAARETRRRDVQERQRREREQREQRTRQHEHDDDRDHRQHARDRERDQQHDLLDLLDVGVRVRHQLTGLRVVVEREVQTLQVRDESHAQIRFDAVRETERGVAAQAGADRLHDTDREDDRGPLERDIEVAGNDAFVDRLPGERGNRDARAGPHQTGQNAHPHPKVMGSNGGAHEAPSRPSILAFVLHNAPGSPIPHATSANLTLVSGLFRGRAGVPSRPCPALPRLLRPRPFAPPASC